jgi:F-type H+-transporting ATPase subunit delta
MKVTPKQYAEALYESVKGKNEEEVKAVIKNFSQLLLARRQAAKLDEIIKYFLEIVDEKEGRVKVKIKTAHPLDTQTVEEIKKYLLNFLGVREIILNIEITPRILGGVIIQYKDKVIDGSLRGRLEKLGEIMRR